MTDQQDFPWSVETMRLINELTPDIKGKAFNPDWFFLRQWLEQFEAAAQLPAGVPDWWMVPAPMEQWRIYGDEPVGPQMQRADYVNGWNACREAMLSAAPQPDSQKYGEGEYKCNKLRPGALCPVPESCRENGCSAVERELLASAHDSAAPGGDVDLVDLVAREFLAAEHEKVGTPKYTDEARYIRAGNGLAMSSVCAIRAIRAALSAPKQIMDENYRIKQLRNAIEDVPKALVAEQAGRAYSVRENLLCIVDKISAAPQPVEAEGREVIETALAKAIRSDPNDVPIQLDCHEARIWHQAQASAYQHALEMMVTTPPPEQPAIDPGRWMVVEAWEHDGRTAELKLQRSLCEGDDTLALSGQYVSIAIIDGAKAWRSSGEES